MRWGAGGACGHAGLLMDAGNYLQWSRLTLHMHACLIGWNRGDTNQVNLVPGWNWPRWRSPEERLEWAGALDQQTGSPLRITRIFHEEKMNACPAPCGELRQRSPRREREHACAGESLRVQEGEETHCVALKRFIDLNELRKFILSSLNLMFFTPIKMITFFQWINDENWNTWNTTQHTLMVSSQSAAGLIVGWYYNNNFIPPRFDLECQFYGWTVD